MNRRSFLSLPAVAALPQTARAAANPVRMRLGCQSAPTNDEHLAYLARYGVRDITGYPAVADGRLYATREELKTMLGMAERHKIKIEGIALPFLTSSHIDKEKHGAIVL